MIISVVLFGKSTSGDSISTPQPKCVTQYPDLATATHSSFNAQFILANKVKRGGGTNNSDNNEILSQKVSCANHHIAFVMNYLALPTHPFRCKCALDCLSYFAKQLTRMGNGKCRQVSAIDFKTYVFFCMGFSSIGWFLFTLKKSGR